jgi:hypothetical protein
MHDRTRLVLAALALFAAPVFAGLPTDAKGRADVIGSPATIQVQPASITLSGTKARQQLVITGTYAAGSPRDLTALCDITANAPGVVSVEGGYLAPLKNGTVTLTIKAGPKSVQVPITVKDMEKADPVSFKREVIASLNVGGCNAGACHGTPSGKGGFRLSLRGFDPAADFEQITRDVIGRRGDPLAPDRSLIMLKALGRIPHEGGSRFGPTSVPAQTIRNWMKQGMLADDAKLAEVKKIEVLPGSRVQTAPARYQQLAVLATYTDGSVRDVTRLTVFSSSDTSVADVSPTGLVEFKGAGEVAILSRYLMELNTIRLTYLEPRAGFVWKAPPENNYVDKHAFAKLKMLSIPPSELCTEEEFVRRAYLDAIGVMPTAEEVKAYLADKDTAKRTKLIDKLLERSEFADFWTMKWSDVLRSSRKTLQVKGTHGFQRWLRARIKKDIGFDEVVRELITAKGSSSSNPAANYYRIARDPQNLAETTAQLFFGIRMQCAKCHNHPFERWTQDDYYSTAAWFARVKQVKDAREPGAPNVVNAEVIFEARGGEVNQPRTGRQMAPKFLGGAIPEIKGATERREVLAKWMTAPENPFFAKNVANRVWYHLMGRGIVDPVDDFRDSNPSANDELLDALAKDLATKKFSIKHLVRTIMNSRTYQLSAEGTALNKDDAKYFSHAVTKLLPAEPLLDAICQATDVPEKFKGMPAGTRAVQLPDGDPTHPFLKTFGQPARELACECERESDSNLAQALQLINGPTVNDKLRFVNNRIGKLMAKKATPQQMLEEIYLATLSRPPSAEDVKIALEYVSKSKEGPRKAWEDVQWALINTKEFLFRH